MRHISIIIVIIMGAVIMCMSCGCSNNQQYARYESNSPAFDIIFEYVAGWDRAEQKGSHGSFIQAALYEPAAGQKTIRANMVVTIEPAAKLQIEPGTIEAYAQDLISRRMHFKNAKAVSKKTAGCAGQPAIELVLEYRVLDNPESLNAVYVPVKERIVIFKKNDAFYILRYAHDTNKFNTFAKAFEHMLASIQFKTGK
jgi:hypothetical protein